MDPNMKKWILFFLLTVSLQAIAQDKPSEEVYEQKKWEYIGKHHWKLIQLDGKSIEAAHVYLHFDPKQKMISGLASCNTFSGFYKATSDKISCQSMLFTEKMCANMAVEIRIMDILNNPELRYDVAEQTLNFYIGNDLVLMFGVSKLPSCFT